MNEFLRRNPAAAALAGAAILLALALVLEVVFVRPAIDTGAGRKPSAGEAKLLPPLASAPPEQAYPETAARPLFTPTRRPAPEPAAQQQAAFQPGQFVLLGVTVAGDNRIAMLREKSTGRIYRIPRGGEVNGIKLATIERDTVTLAMGGQQEQLPLTVQKGAAPGQPTPGGPGAVPAASATMHGPFGGGTPGGASGVPHPGAPVPFPSAVAPGQGPAPPMPVAPGSSPNVPFPGAPVPASAPPTPAPNATADPYAGLSPEEVLARRRARRAQTSQ